MLKNLLLVGVSFTSASQRELAETAVTDKNQFIEFDMEHTSNEGYKFHYANKGDDWSQIEGLAAEDNMCGLDNQSPINLLQPIGSYGWAYGYPKSKFDDAWESNYENVENVLVEWDYNKVQVKFDQKDASQMFMQSNFAT